MNVAFIPVRGGSKSIPLKNIKPICGKPLVYWTVKAACECGYIDKVYVATDSSEIKKVLLECCREDNICTCHNGGDHGFTGYNDGNHGSNESGVSSERDAGNGKENAGGISEKKSGMFCKLEIIGRSAESATDTASTEFAMLEFASSHEFDNMVLIQATSPLLSSDDLDKGFEAFDEQGVDSVLSVVRQKRFNWGIGDNGYAHPTNYDVFKRPRRQDFDGYLVENGAFYITSREDLLKSKNRLSGNIKAVEMPDDTFFEIDEPSDWEIIEGLMKKRLGYGNHKTSMQIIDNPELIKQCDNASSSEICDNDIPEIKMFLTDCDGCLTDAGMYYSPEGDFLKKYNTKDGMGMKLLRENGVLVGIVTGENVDINKRRVEKLKLNIYEPGCKDKLRTVRQLCREHGIDMQNVAFVGDDVNDLEVMKNVGFPCTVADGHKSVKAVAKYIAKEPGGHGAVRDIIDYILENNLLVSASN
ncbi:acylneuraminate cytidylyltransferase [Butyrivibrio sp. LC3010]|uniref:acylneuraminate cytidylyltransferase n=1 Tax=Butyrivibrio sp. LC3010 TaxID=1280680 RepID=UPI0004139F90|nr:acylneuraminate cytidylyltransferase [Butyrivibrio sp. LC3010]